MKITIKEGSLEIECDAPEELDVITSHLCTPLSNDDLADLYGVGVRTVVRWKISGRIPNKDGFVMRADILKGLAK